MILKDIPKPAPVVIPVLSGTVTTRCQVQENNISRTFTVTVEPLASSGSTEASGTIIPVVPTAPVEGTPVFSTFAGLVEVIDIKVKVGDAVSKGQVMAQVEAMKAQHDITAPCDGKISALHVAIGDEVDSSKPILTIA